MYRHSTVVRLQKIWVRNSRGNVSSSELYCIYVHPIEVDSTHSFADFYPGFADAQRAMRCLWAIFHTMGKSEIEVSHWIALGTDNSRVNMWMCGAMPIAQGKGLLGSDKTTEENRLCFRRVRLPE